ncbi:(2Fe-2S)-binding protein [Mycolicibacterium sp. XJ1819]
MSRPAMVGPDRAGRNAPVDATRILAEISTVSPYFAVSCGAVSDDSWYPVHRLYTDTELLTAIVGRVQSRIGTDERRVAVSTFQLGLAARLWSIGLGALIRHGVLPDLDAEQLLFSETAGRIRLHIEKPVAWQGDGLETLLANQVLDGHLAVLTAALHRLGPISARLLRGNAASALLSAARVIDRATTSDPAEQLARRLCADERLDGEVIFNGAGYRRTSCCLYYRTPGGGVCGDCVFITKPGPKPRPGTEKPTR